MDDYDYKPMNFTFSYFLVPTFVEPIPVRPISPPTSPGIVIPIDEMDDNNKPQVTTVISNDLFPNDTNSTNTTNFSNNFNASVMNNNIFGDTLPNLCGVPGVCKSTAEQTCFNVTLVNCTECSSAASGLFVFIILCLGLAILFGNSLILAVSSQLYKKRTATHIDWYKASLAVADLLTGFQIFFVTFPNFAWSTNSTFEQLGAQRLISQNSGPAIAGGFFYILVFTSSLYHLVLMGGTRLYAINWPYRYRQSTTKSVYVGIGIVWTLSAIVASFPAWFPQHFDFDYYHVTFLYLPSLIISPSSSFTPGIVVLVLLLILPYALMTVLLISTAIFVRKQVVSSKKRLGKKIGDSTQDTFSKEEIAAFKTVSLMQLGFTITLVPLCVASGLLYSGALTCDSFSTPYMVCLYLTMTNSLVNVLVYSVREKKFRSNARDVFRSLKPTFLSDASLTSGTKSTTANSKNKTKSAAQSSTV